jgi:tripartite-type tricarboxylate transporter receptor subunit TctC
LQGILAPVGTHPQILEKLHREIAKALFQNDVRARLNAVAADPIASSPSEFRKYIEAEIAKWSAVAQKANLLIE